MEISSSGSAILYLYSEINPPRKKISVCNQFGYYCTGVPRPSGPEIPKKSQKGLPPRLPASECQKAKRSVEKVPKDPPKRAKKVSKSVFGDFFRLTFLTLPAGSSGGRPFFRITEKVGCTQRGSYSAKGRVSSF